jgi:methionyl-tRNA synthetase
VGTFYITTPIYYVNDEPHIGHAYSTILADVLSRYHRLFGDEVFFSTGTDEHGQKVKEAADKRGIDPKKHCDEMVERFAGLWKKLNISYTKFIRTTEKRHRFVVQNLLTYLYERGDIYFDTYTGKYCVSDERFFTEKDLTHGRCPMCGKDVITIEEKNYFFKLSKYKDWLVGYIKDNKDFIRPESRRNEILGFLKGALSDLCISRPKSRLEWGIEIPFDKKYVTYVWFDALINYISNIGVYRDNESFQKWWPANAHLIGKDIVTTHAVYWPIMLKSAGFEQPQSVFAHGWWLIQEEKMSKSRGNMIRPIELIDKYGHASFRYVLMRNMVLGQDASFSEEGFVTTLNAELANDYGNLLNRLTQMVEKYLGGTIPDPPTHDAKLKDKASKLVDKVREAVEAMELNKALDLVVDYVRSINKYIDDKAPWNLHKQEKTDQLRTVLYSACEAFRLSSVLLAPVLVEKAQEALGVFGEEVSGAIKKTNNDEGMLTFGRLLPGKKIKKGGPLFPRVEFTGSDVQSNGSSRTSAADRVKTGAGSKKEKGSKEMVDIEYFQGLDLKIGTVLKAERIKGSKKLLKIKVDIGEEQRTVIAGIAEHYSPRKLNGAQVVLVANLKPAKIMGETSEGMILAASDGQKLALVQPERDVQPGSAVS